MIQQFYVENFLSFGKRQDISFEASSDKKNLEELTVEVKSGIRLLKIAMIYGANASGKSNVIFAIQTLWQMLFTPQNNKNETTLSYKPFALRKGEPTKLGITFYANDIKYMYELEYDQSTVLYEKLEYVKTRSKALFYERNVSNGIVFGGTLGISKKSENNLKANTLANHTVLSSFAKTNIEEINSEIEILYSWIKDSINEIDNHESILEIAREAKENIKLKDFMKESLTVSDFNITDFEVIDVKREIPQVLRKRIEEDTSLTNEARLKILSSFQEELEFSHRTTTDVFSLNAGDESQGTLQFFQLSRIFYDLINRPCVYLVDEIEESLHYDLVLHFLLRFIRNSNQSQLLFTTHNQLLLDEDFVRRDMVYFTEKSRITAETEVYSANDFGLHKNISLFNAYKIGKMGAKPLLGSTLISKDE